MKLEVSKEELEFLTDVLDWWDEAYEDTLRATVEDPTLESEDDLLRVSDGLYRQQVMINALRSRFREALYGADGV